MARADKLGLTAVRTEGAMLPPSILRRIHELSPTLGGLTPEDFGLSGTRIREAASQAWNSLQGPWNTFKGEREKLGQGEAGTGITRRLWLSQILRVLDYGVIEPLRHSLAVDQTEFAISHLFNNKVPLHLIGCGQDLDRKGGGAGSKRSPHGLVQQLLNSTDRHLWAFLSNGVLWRVLRDDQSLSRQSMVEFDLESIFEGQLYDEFLLFYLVCHQSRVRSEKPEECWLEKWHLAAGEEGKRALNTLRSGVEDAIKALGQGYLSHAANTKLRERIRSGELDKQDYYRQLLRQIYRLIFLFVAEDRGLLADPKASPSAKQLYQDSFSTLRLRRIAERTPGSQRHHDLYSGFKLVLRQLGKAGGCPELGLPALGSFLFSEESAEDLHAAEISNAAFLQAIRRLSTTAEGGRRTRVDYRNLGTEELGSVYESLLELHPEFSRDGSSFQLLYASGNERKTSGSYYTPDSLIQCLLDTALEPVVHEAVSKAGRDAKRREEAILDLKVIDPAVGSGHFLIAAAHRLAKRLAQVRAGEDEPSPHERQKALRDVIGRCLYGIDINPMAAELCRVSLWIESMEPGRPLSFLDHHIVVGNSLLGATPELIAKGIPDGAYDAIEGDDKEVCKNLKKQNKKEREGQGNLFEPHDFAGKDLLAAWQEIEAIPDDQLVDIRRKEKSLRQAEAALERRKLIADAWCAAFTLEKALPKADEPSLGASVTTATIRRLISGLPLPERELSAIKRAAREASFLHPHLAFPGVFAKGGFDVVLGNPPWERVKLQQKEFFAERRPEIASAKNKAERERMIKELAGTQLDAEFRQAKRGAEAASSFIRQSRRFPLAGRGDVNTYPVFAELNRSLLNQIGRAGIIVPSGIASDDTTKFFFSDLMGSKSLASLFDFENGMRESEESGADEPAEESSLMMQKVKGSSEERLLFPSVDSRFKFCLLTMTGTMVQPSQPKFAFFCHRVSDLDAPGKAFTLTPEDIALLNPNTKTCPVFRTQRDAEITKAIYRQNTVLADLSRKKLGPQLSIRRVLDMGNRRVASRTFSLSEICDLQPGTLPIWEGKMISAYNHRACSVVVNVENVSRQAQSKRHTSSEWIDPSFSPSAAFGINALDVRALYDDDAPANLLAFKDVGSVTNERTMIACALPFCGTNFSLRIIEPRPHRSDWRGILLALLNSFCFDYALRQKLGGLHVSDFITLQLPSPCIWLGERDARIGDVREFIIPRALELTYCSNDLHDFALELGYNGPPFKWDEVRRFWLRAELDAAFFHLYGINREDVDYIMETFPIVKRKDIAAHGTFRTKEAILRIYDEMAKASLMPSGGDHGV